MWNSGEEDVQLLNPQSPACSTGYLVRRDRAAPSSIDREHKPTHAMSRTATVFQLNVHISATGSTATQTILEATR